ncbi:MAG: hypothetical protein K2Q17_10640 [Nitrospiraceae bacterium]|nr:hypothetical protein [Nitrospiraceae bacterium]
MTSEKKSSGWSSIRRHLDVQSKPALLALVKDLYDASSTNRNFLHARVQVEAGDGTVVEKYRRTIVEQFYPQRGFGKLKLAEARNKAIRDYHRATGDLTGTIDLMLTYVETGTQFTRDFGDINEAYYNSLESVLREMTQLLRKEEPALYPQFRERILQLEAHADYIGWGYGDALREHVRMLEAGVSGKRK